MIGAGRGNTPRGFSARKSLESPPPDPPDPADSAGFIARALYKRLGPIWGPAFCPLSRLMTKDHHWKDRKCFEGKEPIDFVTRTEATGVSRLSGGDLFELKRRYPPPPNKKLKNILSFLERKMGITEVPVVRTEHSLRLS